jgi:two-component system, response regulator YesN
MLAFACSQAITARRYTSDGAGNIRYINDQEPKSTFEYEAVDKSVDKLEQLLKVGTKQEISDYLEEMLDGRSRGGIDYLIIQILATAHRCVSVLSDGNALSELFSSNNFITSKLSFDFNERYKKELISLCLDARDMISRSQRHETELLCDKALQIINDEYMNEALSLTDASEKLGVSPNYLSALIKKTKSQNFVSLVTERRMKAASDLLLCTSMKIFEISQKCGYSDQHYFSYCFKRYYGMSPNKYREEHLGAGNV